MLLEGSCHCGAVKFSLQSRTPHPFMLCYCSICRKTGGGGGYAINIMGSADTLEIQSTSAIAIYRASNANGSPGGNRRHFCSLCGSALWCANPAYGEWVYPFASAIDTPLPAPPQLAHIMENYRPDWVAVPEGAHHAHFGEYPAEGIHDWHESRGLLEPE